MISHPASGVEQIRRDTFHASRGLGCYALGMLWYTLLTGRDIRDNSFGEFDEDVSARQVALAKQCVQTVAEAYRK